MARITHFQELFNALRYQVRYDIAWRAMLHDLQLCSIVYHQTQRWLTAGCFEAWGQNLRAVLRIADGRSADTDRGDHRQQNLALDTRRQAAR